MPFLSPFEKIVDAYPHPEARIDPRPIGAAQKQDDVVPAFGSALTLLSHGEYLSENLPWRDTGKRS
ncbi:MAG: hypothetical protein R6V46_03500 [Desulfatiglandaceae bacterium]